jgi:hypothetical protein
MLAELVDAMVGVDPHRDTHQVEIAHPTGTPIATCTISNDSTGYVELLTWIFDHAPGPSLVVSIEGTRSYGLGLTLAITAADLAVVECEQLSRKTRRGKGKSDAIDADLAVLAALQLDTDRLPTDAPTATAKPYASCSAPARISPLPAPPRPTGSAPSCSAETTSTASSPAQPSPTRFWPAWLADGSGLT